MRVRGRRPGTADVVDVVIQGERIAAVEPAAGAADLGGHDWVVAPALIDLQVNGYGGLDFNSRFWNDAPATPEHVAEVAEKLAASGTGRFCPTLVTNAPDLITQALECIVAAREQDPAIAHAVPGIHLEGPFLAPEDGPRGAHPLEFVHEPDWDLFQRFQEAAGGLIRILTLAPERPGAIALIERVVASGVVASIGHSNAEAEDVQRAVAAGATLSTHLGNGSHSMIRRHPNYIWEQMAADELTACIISDGQHLPASVVKSLARVKGPERLCVVSDCVALGGLPPGIYDHGRHEVLPSGRVNLAGTPYLAGAGHLLDTCLANAWRWTGYDEADVVRTVTANPARVLGLSGEGVLEPGAPADVCWFRWPEGDGPLAVGGTITGGQVRFRA